MNPRLSHWREVSCIFPMSSILVSLIASEYPLFILMKCSHKVSSLGFIGDPSDGIGYIDLSGFASDAGREVRYAIRALQHGSSQIAASDSDIRDDWGLVATDPTKLKVSINVLNLK